MSLRLATFVTVVGAMLSSGWAMPDAYADPTPQDQQFLNLVRSNGVVRGDNETLIKYGKQFCEFAGVKWELPARPELIGQGVVAVQLYIVRMAASRVYCPDNNVTLPSAGTRSAAPLPPA
jgi:hypothetical protein